MRHTPPPANPDGSFDGEVFAPGPARSLIVPPPVVYQDYPKTLVHLQGVENHFPPVIVNDYHQESDYTAKGYIVPGQADPFGFLTAKATVKIDDAIRTMNSDLDRKLETLRQEVHDFMHGYLDETLAHVNDAIDQLKSGHNLLITRNQTTESKVAQLARDQRDERNQRDQPKTRKGFWHWWGAKSNG